MLTVNEYCKNRFGSKVYKISLSAGCSCPNRDGKIGHGGCIFCSAAGSGDFAQSGELPIAEQIVAAKKQVSKKYKGNKYIAYFGNFTNTYGDTERLEKIFTQAISDSEIVALSIATRPDCLESDKLEMIARLNKIKPVWVELGLQSSNIKTAEYIRRGYPNEVYEKAVNDLRKIGVHIITHIIIGLPYETEEDMVASVKYACRFTDGIKLQLLHILKNTDLCAEYEKGKFEVLSLEEYIGILKECIAVIPERVVVHRLTGDGPKKLLVAPLWSADKKNVLNEINKVINIS
ncbi:MAG: TIGR01212 family radical SAM protein [Clostridiales bacterium]|nr:TIGR01212 family radical SAM protein [Candidatus Equinaster intestinalis]